MTAPQADRSDRYFYAGMAWFLVLVTVAGFAPRSLGVLSGATPSPPLVVHMHAFVMLSWTVLMALQASLSFGNRMDLHRRLGMVSLLVGPAVLMVLTLVTVARQQDSSATPAAPIVNNILFLQIRAIVMFPLFFIWALATRQRDPQTHKRMVLMATLMLIDAAIARMSWLPLNTFPLDYTMIHAYLLLLPVPALAYDFVKLGRIHRAWLWGYGLTLPWVLATEFIWNSPWWREFGPKLVGVDN
jgi:hypothetical protein